MNDAISGIVVAAITAIGVAGIFFWTNQAKKKRIAALCELCVQRGWTYRHDSGSLHHGHRIEGDGWVFEAVSRSGGRETAPGSSDWGHASQWSAEGADPGRSTYILGSRPGGMMDVSRMPLSLLSRFLGDEIAGMQPIDAGGALAEKYILFAPAGMGLRKLLPARSEELLRLWPAGVRLVVRSSPARLRLQVADKRLEKREDVLRLIELGESLAAR